MSVWTPIDAPQPGFLRDFKPVKAPRPWFAKKDYYHIFAFRKGPLMLAKITNKGKLTWNLNTKWMPSPSLPPGMAQWYRVTGDTSK